VNCRFWQFFAWITTNEHHTVCIFSQLAINDAIMFAVVVLLKIALGFKPVLACVINTNREKQDVLCKDCFE
jgi:hypothetical protein